MDIILFLIRIFFGFGLLLILYKIFKVFGYKMKKISEYIDEVKEEEKENK
ncbi:hypothetical protein QUF55_02950 [Clostridiaceae bacterium HSG29]|nr:hypothetical protein [Clostridiaceae bacterium HSG29]